MEAFEDHSPDVDVTNFVAEDSNEERRMNLGLLDEVRDPSQVLSQLKRCK